jgi:phage terminase small subunit
VSEAPSEPLASITVAPDARKPKPATRKSKRRKASGEFPINPQMCRFVECYIASPDLNGAKAARDSGYAPKSAEFRASKLLADPRIQKAIAGAMAARSKRTQITADQVLERFWDIAIADPNELVEFRRTCCRHCWGTNFSHQRTAKEMERDKLAWDSRASRKANEIFDEQGGVGYNANREPNSDCPDCFGDGHGSMHMKDTRNLTRSAKRLYAGVKTTKDGIEMKMHDQMAALINVGKHLGMFVERPPAPEDEETRAQKIRDQLDAMDATTLGTTPPAVQPPLAAAA